MKSSKTSTRVKQEVAVDWQDVHGRLEVVRTAMEQGWSTGPEETKQTLKARAQVLAQEVKPARGPQDTLEVIEFMLAYERYAVESSCVREVYPLKDLTPLPCTPAHVLGIINLRGQILPIIDVKRFFDLPRKGLSDLNKVIVLHSEGMTFGILADRIVGVSNVTAAEIQPALATLTGVREAYLMGVTKDCMVVLDATKLLSDKKIVVHETVEA